jgi:hypothetical protein
VLKDLSYAFIGLCRALKILLRADLLAHIFGLVDGLGQY